MAPSAIMFFVGLAILLMASVGAQQMSRNMYNESFFGEMVKGSMRQGRRSAMSDACTTNDNLEGTCMTRFNCMRQGGTAKGFCGTYGVCCETNLQCNRISKLKRTIIKKPTQLTDKSCQYTIETYSSNVCQLLIQLEIFELQQPTLDATNQLLECSDYFEVDRFRLCGDNTGQHLYLPFSAANGVEYVTLNFVLPQRWAQSNWRLVVTQLECPALKKRSHFSNSLLPFSGSNALKDLKTIFSNQQSDLELLAPPGCNQYFTQPSGTIKSFNFVDGLTTYYMPNMNYVICIKPTTAGAMVEYTIDNFEMSNEVVGGNGFDNDCHATINTPGRREDYLMIPQSAFLSLPTLQPTFYCGTSLSAGQTILASQPYAIYFVSDERTDQKETGFRFDYRLRSVLN